MEILGINFDKQCSIIKHCKEREKIVYRRSALIKKVGGKRWGANKKIKLQLYKQYIRPVLEYGNVVTSKSCITAKGILGLAERRALRSITRAEWGTSNEKLYQLAQIEKIDERIDRLAAYTWSKMQANETRWQVQIDRLKTLT